MTNGRRGRSSGRDRREALKRHVRTKGATYLADPNITSVGVGYKIKGGKRSKILSLQFTVGKRAETESELEALGTTRIPEKIEVDGEMVPTDVIERDFAPSYKMVQVEALGDRRERRDPIQPGLSVAHVEETAGTIGLIAFDRELGTPGILSNWHVLHGDHGAIGDTVVQPGPHDDSDVADNACGTLLRSHLGAAGDCAFARIRDRGFEREIFELGVTPTGMAEVDLGDHVIKSGRTTGVTHGIVRRVDVMAKIDYGGAGVKEIGCFEIGPDPDRPAPDDEISRGGDSGSAWLIFDDKSGEAKPIFAGLHFAGEGTFNPDEHALACYPRSVTKKLEIVLEPPEVPLEEDELEAVVPRDGYDPHFIGVTVPLPTLSRALKRDAVNFGRRNFIPYTHFSVCLSAERRLPRFVAWNVDGARRVTLKRKSFRLDPRIDDAHQLGETLYEDNPLDRGHIARRADLNWGTVPEARQANKDSFFFTNIAPQHRRFNQSKLGGLWGGLENLVLEQAETDDIRVSVMGGPIFRDDDIAYRGARIPRRFWKAIAYRGTDGGLRVAAFILSQRDLLTDFERLDFEPFEMFQVTLQELADQTDLGFDALLDADVAAHPELAIGGLEPEEVAPGATPIAGRPVRVESDVLI